MSEPLAIKLATHLKQLRQNEQWSLDQLASRTGISRASLSRIENADVSPTTEVLNKLCVAYAIKMSKLLAMLEEEFTPFISHKDQIVWTDPNIGFRRRAVSPPTNQLAGEILECSLEPDTLITYNKPSIPGLEHHILILEGKLTLTVGEATYQLQTGDCLRYQSANFIQYQTSKDIHAKYLVFLVGG